MSFLRLDPYVEVCTKGHQIYLVTIRQLQYTSLKVRERLDLTVRTGCRKRLPRSHLGVLQTVELRPVNAATSKKSWPLPHLDGELLEIADSDCFDSLDFASGY